MGLNWAVKQTESGQVLLADSGWLSWWSTGGGEPLLLVHPSGTDHHLSDRLVPHLSTDRRVIAYDLRGHGRSPAGPDDYRHADDLVRLIDGLGLDRVDLLGASYGGQIAIDVATAHPARVRSLAVLAASLPDHGWSSEVLAFAEAFEVALTDDDLDRAADLWLEIWLRGPKRTWDEVDATLADRLRTPAREAFASQRAAAGEDLGAHPGLPERLGEIRCPTLALVGEYDTQDFSDIAARLAGTVAGAEWQVVPAAGHLFCLEEPERTAEPLRRFLDAANG